jgi:hypothetical protein
MHQQLWGYEIEDKLYANEERLHTTEIDEYNVSGKPERKRPIGCHRRKCMDNIKMNLNV